jgi:hypothetical protein
LEILSSQKDAKEILVFQMAFTHNINELINDGLGNLTSHAIKISGLENCQFNRSEIAYHNI